MIIISKPIRKTTDFSEFSQRWSKEEFQEFLESQVDFSVIDVDDWKLSKVPGVGFEPTET